MKTTIIGLVILVVSLAVGVSLAGSGIITYDTLVGITVLVCIATAYVTISYIVDKPVKHFKYGQSTRTV